MKEETSLFILLSYFPVMSMSDTNINFITGFFPIKQNH